MKTLGLFLVTLFVGGSVLAQSSGPSLVAVSGVRIDSESGCGQPPPNGGGCPPAVTKVSFTVPFGGLCHTYSVAVTAIQGGNLLSILDSAMPNCTRPEQRNFSTSVRLTSDFGSGPISLANPLFVQAHLRP